MKKTQSSCFKRETVCNVSFSNNDFLKIGDTIIKKGCDAKIGTITYYITKTSEDSFDVSTEMFSIVEKEE